MQGCSKQLLRQTQNLDCDWHNRFLGPLLSQSNPGPLSLGPGQKVQLFPLLVALDRLSVSTFSYGQIVVKIVVYLDYDSSNDKTFLPNLLAHMLQTQKTVVFMREIQLTSLFS